MGTTKQAMNYLLGQLEHLDYLTRSDDADDQRAKRVHLTERGEAVRQTIRGIVMQIEQELEAELGTDAYGDLRRLLVRLNDTETIKDEGHGS